MSYTAPIAATPTIEIFASFAKWINQRSRIDFRNYGEVSSFRAEQRTIGKQKTRAMKALYAAESFPFDAAAMSDALTRNFSGRLQWVTFSDGTIGFDYSTGQYWPTEYRQAAAVVLEAYVHAVTPKILPNASTRFNTIQDIARASLAAGSHWFDKGSMKFFNCRLMPDIFHAADGRILFVTSEDNGYDGRKFSVRAFDPKNADIDTIGDFNSYETKASALKAAKEFASKVGA